MSSVPIGPQRGTLERSTSEQDLSVIVLNSQDGNSSCQSAGSCLSLPDLTGNPYYQICLSDLQHLKALQQNGSTASEQKNPTSIQETSTVDSSSSSLRQQMISELSGLRNENFKLLNVAMKNDQNMRSMVDRHQTILGKLAELNEENRLLRKKNQDIENKMELVQSQVKLVATEMEQIKSANGSLKKEAVQMTKEEETKSRNLASISSEEFDSLSSYSSKLEQRIESLDGKLHLRTQESIALNEQLTELNQRLASEERARSDLADTLTYLNDMNQLMQVKLLAMESKISTVVSATTSPLEQSSFQMSIPSSVMASRMYPDPHSVHSLSPPADNPPPYRLLNEENDSFCKPQQGKFTATVPPLNQQLSYPRNDQTGYQASAPEQAHNPALPSTSASVSSEQQESAGDYHRRHRRHHRVKLFPSRRRH